MPQVLNRSKNASTLINGIKFSPTAKGMISEEITQEEADYFLKMPNYVSVKAPAAKTSVATDAAAESSADAAAGAPPHSESEAAGAK